MKLKELYDRYASGELEKHKYIGAMHKKHQILFEYFDYIKDTDVQSKLLIILYNGQITIINI